MIRCKRNAAVLLLLFAAIGLATAPFSLAGEKPVKVTMVKRTEGGEYGQSAYSFRFASQDAEIHRNHVDLFFESCGLVHLGTTGTKNRIARVEGKKLSDVDSLPTDGWLESSFAPNKGELYALEIFGDEFRFRVKLRIVDVKGGKITFEWLPLRVSSSSSAGVAGQCGGGHPAR